MTTEPLRVALYVDTQHLWFASRTFGKGQGYRDARVDYDALLNVIFQALRRLHPDREITFAHQRAYCTTRSRALGFTNALRVFGYEVREHMLRSPDDTFDWDTQLVVDVFRDHEDEPFDVLVIVSGDGDFLPLVERWPDLVVFGFPGSTSPRFPSVIYLGPEVLYHA